MVVPVVSTMGPGASPSWRARKPRVSPSAMKQTSWLSGLSATRKTTPRRLRADLVLGRCRRGGTSRARAGRGSARPARRTGPSRWSTRAAQQAVAASRAWWPVHTASKPSARARSRTARELDLLVAAHARVGRAAGRVLGHEVVDDVARGTRSASPRRRTGCRARRRRGGRRARPRACSSPARRSGGAAGWRTAPDGRRHVVAGVDRPRGGRRRIDAAGQGGEHP